MKRRKILKQLHADRAKAQSLAAEYRDEITIFQYWSGQTDMCDYVIRLLEEP